MAFASGRQEEAMSSNIGGDSSSWRRNHFLCHNEGTARFRKLQFLAIFGQILESCINTICSDIVKVRPSRN